MDAYLLDCEKNGRVFTAGPTSLSGVPWYEKWIREAGGENVRIYAYREYPRGYVQVPA